MWGAWQTIARAGCTFIASSLFAGQLASLSSEARAHYELATEHLRAGQVVQAEREFLRALALDPSRDEILLDASRSGAGEGASVTPGYPSRRRSPSDS